MSAKKMQVLGWGKNVWKFLLVLKTNICIHETNNFWTTLPKTNFRDPMKKQVGGGGGVKKETLIYCMRYRCKNLIDYATKVASHATEVNNDLKVCDGFSGS